MDSHEKYAALLDAFIDGELPEQEAEAVRAHLAVCADCQGYVSDALTMRDGFPDIEETPVPDGFREAALSALPPRKITYWKTALLPLAACAAVVLLIQGVSGFPIGSRGALAPESAEAETEESVPDTVPDTDLDGGVPILNAAFPLPSPEPSETSGNRYDALDMADAASSKKSAPEQRSVTAEDTLSGSVASATTEAPSDEYEEEEPSGQSTAGPEAGAGESTEAETVTGNRTGPEAAGNSTEAEAVTGNSTVPEVAGNATGPEAASGNATNANAETPLPPDDYAAMETLPEEFSVTEAVPEEDAEAELFSAPASVWTIPVESIVLLEDYAPAGETEYGVWYALTAEEFDELSLNLSEMGLETVPGAADADNTPPITFPGVVYVFVPLYETP